MNRGETNGTRCTLDPQVDLSHVLQNSPSMLCPTCSVRLLNGDAWMQKECKLTASKVASFDSECRNGKIIFYIFTEKCSDLIEIWPFIEACLSVPIRTY